MPEKVNGSGVAVGVGGGEEVAAGVGGGGGGGGRVTAGWPPGMFPPRTPGALSSDGGTVSWTGDQPTALFDALSRDIQIQCSGLNLSAITSALIDVSSGQDHVEFSRCLINSSAALTSSPMYFTYKYT